VVRRCEAQRSKAENELRQVMGNATTQPQASGQASAALTQVLLDDMLDEEEVGIRLLGGGTDRELSHAMNVGVISLLIGRTLGMSEADLLDLGVGALLHDVGKQAQPPRHRQIHEGSSAADVQAYREHVALGVQVGQRMGLSEGALAVLAQHHEQADGAGFPRQLPRDQISLAARVVCIVNRYDGLCNPRSGAPGLTPHEAVALLFAQHRQRFDGAVLNAFIRMMGVYPAGSIVQLTDDRYALVVGANSSRPLKPRVLVFDPAVPRAQALLLNLEHVRDLGIRRSLTAQRLPTEALHYLDPRPRVAYYFEPLAPERPAAAPAS
jgi:putative nucleotidyltransferase with HDIG domain